jgi:hypothetical protein
MPEESLAMKAILAIVFLFLIIVVPIFGWLIVYVVIIIVLHPFPVHIAQKQLDKVPARGFFRRGAVGAHDRKECRK